jgi:transposase
MIKRERKKQADGSVKTFIRVVEGYRPGPGLPPKQRAIKPFGWLEDQDDPESFMRMVEEFNATYKQNEMPLMIEAIGTAKMYGGESRRQNYGYKYLSAIYDMLGIDAFIADYEQASSFRGKYSLAQIFKFLVLLRVLYPDSKRASFQMKNELYSMDIGFGLDDVYKALSKFADFETDIQRYLNTSVKSRIGRDLSHAFYDVTNYFFQIDYPDGEGDLRKKGVSKEHRLDPIVAMGLFIDSNGLPVSMSIFPGNTSESLTLQPTMDDVKASYGLGRLIVVADKGINSSKNIDAIVGNGDGFIFSQQLKGKKGLRYNEKLFDQDGWTWNKDRSYAYKLFDEDYVGLDKDQKKETRKRKVLLYWDSADAGMARKKREEKLRKAEKATRNNAYAIKHGYEEFTKEDIVNTKTGECLDDVKKIRTVDMEKAEKDAMYDGFFCIITSELGYDEKKIREAYHGLWRIEQSFRILKSDLYARPVFVSKNEHIRAHFLICFVALLVVRVLQHKMGTGALSAERIARALGAANCCVLRGGIIQMDDVGGAVAFKKRKDKNGRMVDTLEYSSEDEIALDYKAVQELFGTDIYNVYYRQEVFNKILKNISID